MSDKALYLVDLRLNGDHYNFVKIILKQQLSFSADLWHPVMANIYFFNGKIVLLIELLPKKFSHSVQLCRCPDVKCNQDYWYSNLIFIVCKTFCEWDSTGLVSATKRRFYESTFRAILKIASEQTLRNSLQFWLFIYELQYLSRLGCGFASPRVRSSIDTSHWNKDNNAVKTKKKLHTLLRK